MGAIRKDTSRSHFNLITRTLLRGCLGFQVCYTVRLHVILEVPLAAPAALPDSHNRPYMAMDCSQTDGAAPAAGRWRIVLSEARTGEGERVGTQAISTTALQQRL